MRLVALVLLVGCEKPHDACQRAVDQCRHGAYAQYDPVLRCAMDSPSDEAAKSCIETGLDQVVKPSAGVDGRGLNPLLHER